MHIKKKMMGLSSPIVPEKKKDFRAKFLIFLCYQFSVVTTSLLIYFLGYYLGQVGLQILGLLILSISQFVLFIRQSGISMPLASRLIDIYPTLSKRNPFTLRILVGVLLLCPLTALALFTLLLFKDRQSPKKLAPYFFRRPGLSIPAVAILILLPLGLQITLPPSVSSQLHLNSISYLVSDHATYYIVSLGEEVGTLMRIKRELTSNERSLQTTSLFDHLSQIKSPSVSGLVLMSSLVVMQHMKNGLRNPAQDNAHNSAGRYLVEDLVRVVNIWDKTPPLMLKLNPISTFTPFVSVETGIISLVELSIESKFRQVFIGKLVDILHSLEAKGMTSEDDQKEIARIRSVLESTRIYGAYTKSKDSWISQHLR